MTEALPGVQVMTGGQESLSFFIVFMRIGPDVSALNLTRGEKIKSRFVLYIDLCFIANNWIVVEIRLIKINDRGPIALYGSR